MILGESISIVVGVPEIKKDIKNNVGFGGRNL
jgi:hypothetical protein